MMTQTFPPAIGHGSARSFENLTQDAFAMLFFNSFVQTLNISYNARNLSERNSRCAQLFFVWSSL
jgi:hypothetical protein